MSAARARQPHFCLPPVEQPANPALARALKLAPMDGSKSPPRSGERGNDDRKVLCG
jgi:hypothetical protein